MKFTAVLRNTYTQILFVLSAFTIMVLTSYYFVGDIVEKTMTYYGEKTLTSARAHARATLKSAEVSLENIAYAVESIVNNGGSPEDILAYFEAWSAMSKTQHLEVLRVYSHIKGITIDGFSNTLIAENFEAVVRPWYIGALDKKQNIHYSEPYHDPNANQMVISLSKNIHTQHGSFIGVVAVDMNVSDIARQIHGMRLMGNGYGVLLNQHHMFVVHPEASLTRTDITKAEGAISPSYAALGKELVGHGTVMGNRFIDYDGTDSIGFFQKMFNGWHIGIITSVENYYSSVTRMAMTLSLLASLLALGLCYLLVSLSAAKLRSDAANRVKASFIANLSHEIRTPMNAIMGMSELILREKPESPEIAEYAHAIRNAGANLLDIINDVLDISKIEAGKLTILSVEYELPSILHDVISIIRMRLDSKPIEFVVTMDAALPFKVIGDETRVKQILLNILSNAAKFTDTGYVMLKVESIIQGTSVELVFTVSDSGIGISKEDITHLFKEFERMETKLNRTIEGSGLGLPITKRLCEMMNGAITVSSTPGRGSTFTARIKQGLASYTPIAHVEKAHQLRIVVHEPSKPVLDSIVTTLRSLRIHCDACQTAAEFLAQLPRARYDYVFIAFAQCTDAMLAHVPAGCAVVCIAEFNTAVTTKNMRVLRKPVTCVQVANILNGAKSSPSYSQSKETYIGFSAPEARVLIVDDNLTNLKVASGLMSPYNMRLDTALSGFEALEKITSAQYDIVFMDHMMPKMDGIETTAAIRRIPGRDFQHLPVIALTANAVNGAREMFIEKGMNDFLPKPIDSKKLDYLLKKYIPKEKRAAAVPLAPRGEQRRLEIEEVDVQKGLANCCNTLEAYLSVLSVFYRDGVQKLPALKKMKALDDVPAFTTLIHGLKSACATIGAQDASTLAARLETAGRKNDTEFISDHLHIFSKNFETLLERIFLFLEKHLPRDRAGRQIGDELLLHTQLRALEHELQNSDIAAIETILHELFQYSWDEATTRKLENIKRCTDIYDFEGGLDFLGQCTDEGHFSSASHEAELK